MNVTALPTSLMRYAALPAPAAPVVGPGQVCTLEVKDRIDHLLADASMEADSATMAYGMGFCVGGIGGALAADFLGPIGGILIGGGIFAGGIMLGRYGDRHADELIAQAKQINDQYQCYPADAFKG